MTSYSISQVLDTMLGPSVFEVLLAILAGLVVIHLGLGFGVWIIHRLEGEKAKREPLSSDDPTEPDYTPVDYVVGIGDDGELVYASEKPKNDDRPE